MGQRFKGFMPVVLFFILLNAMLISGKNTLKKWETDQEVLIIGNAILFLVTLVSFLMLKRSFRHSNPNVFVRSVFGSFMIKLLVCIIAVFIYISVFRQDLNKPALFTCMALYLVYTIMEVAALMKLLKQKANG